MGDEFVLQRNKNRLRQAVQIIHSYDFSLPINVFLHNLYRENKQMGSTDRKQLSTIIYQFLRLGNNLSDIEIEKKIGVAIFLCNNYRKSFFEFIINEYTPFVPIQMELSIKEKIEIISRHYPEFKIEKIFPLTRYFSKLSDAELFIESNLIQPKVWIRIKRGKKEEVLQEIKEYDFAYQEMEFSELCFCFEKHYPLHQFKSYLNGSVAIQDGGSQLTGTYFKPKPDDVWWDACAGSGGKSLMLLDQEPTDRKRTR